MLQQNINNTRPKVWAMLNFPVVVKCATRETNPVTFGQVLRIVATELGVM